MAGNKVGGVKAAKSNKERHGNDYYKRIGSIGGKKTGMKGFALNKELAREAGRKGGTISRRTKVTE